MTNTKYSETRAQSPPMWWDILKSLWSFARVVRWEHVDRTRNANCAEVCLSFIERNKIFWWPHVTDTFVWEIQEMRWRCMGFTYIFLFLSGADWLGRQSYCTTCMNLYSTIFTPLGFYWTTWTQGRCSNSVLGVCFYVCFFCPIVVVVVGGGG